MLDLCLLSVLYEKFVTKKNNLSTGAKVINTEMMHPDWLRIVMWQSALV